VGLKWFPPWSVKRTGKEAAEAQTRQSGDSCETPSTTAAPHQRLVMVYATVSGDTTGALRQDLVRIFGAEMDLLRFAPITGDQQVRLSLRLPKARVAQIMDILSRYGPVIEFMEVPETSSSSWLDDLLARPISVKAGKAIGDTREHVNPIAEILAPEDILLDLDIDTKPELFRYIGEVAAQRHGLAATPVAEKLAARERGGATAVGRGLAIPHARLKNLAQALAFYIRPRNSLAFDSPDGEPVTDILVLLVPERANRQHLDLLAIAAQLFCDNDFRETLGRCTDPQAVYRAFCDSACAVSHPPE
jgi:PTS system nitrogen regulatory IIA component